VLVLALVGCGGVGHHCDPDCVDFGAGADAGLGHHAQCTDGIGGSLGTCAVGLVCEAVPACVGSGVDFPSLCLSPGETYCQGTGELDGGL
jgi:hypothetical protein